MKLVLDEKFKHRLIGLAVILSLGFILAPAVMRKSNQTVEDHFNVQVKLPGKPLAPEVVVSNEEMVFKTIKVAKVALPAMPENKPLTALVKAQPLQSEAITVVKVPPIPQLLPIAKIEAKPPVKKPEVKAAPKATIATDTKVAPGLYAVQLASFTKLTNAQALVNRLQAKGYKANLLKVNGQGGLMYKVYAGYSPHKNEVIQLQTKLAAAMQLNGFIVTTRVS